VAGFAAGGSAGVQDVFAVLWGEQGGGVLRGGVLYADGAVVKAGDVLDVVAVRQGNGLRVQRVGAGVAVRGEPGSGRARAAGDETRARRAGSE